MKKIFKIKELEKYPFFHGFFNREYGNISYFYADNQEVIQNRESVAEALNTKANNLYEMEQIHSNNIRVIKNKEQKKLLKETDGIITDQKNVYLFLKTADCFPVILFSLDKKVLALLHVGWKGCMQHIIERAVLKMVNKYQVQPNDLVAGIGPGIRKCCYKFNDLYQKNIPEWENYISNNKQQFQSVDLAKFIYDSLQKSGIENIFDSKLCTGCSQQFFSHYKSKRSEVKKGLFATVAVIN